MFEVSTILEDDSAELVSGGANGFINASLSNSGTSSCGSTFVELIREDVVSLFCEVLGVGASLSMEVKEDASTVSGGSRVVAEMKEVILNGDSPAPRRVIEGVVQPVAPTTVKQKLARKNELKAREKRFGGNKETNKVQKTLLKQQYENFTGLSFESLDQIHDRLQKLISQLEILRESLSQEDINLNLKIYEGEVKNSSSASTSIQNIAFVSSQTTDSTNDPVSVVASVSATSAKNHVSALPNQIDADDLEEMYLKWKGHVARECRLPKDTRRNVAAEPQRRNVPAEEEPTNYALMAFTSSSSSSFDNELRDNALVVLRQKFKKAEQERDDLKLKLEKFQTSSKNLSQLLASQTTDTTGLGYNALVFTSSMFDCDEMFTSEIDESLPASSKYDRYHSGDGYHTVPSPFRGTFMPPKPDLVFHDAPNVNETVYTAFNVELSPTKPDKELSLRPSIPIIEDWVSDSEDDFEAKIPQNAPTANHKTAIPKPKSHGTIRNRKACFVCKSLTHLIKDCDYYEKQMAQTRARNHAQRGNHQQYARMTLLNPQRHMVPTVVLTKSKFVPLTVARQVTTAVSPNTVTRPRPAKTVATKPYLPPRRHINHSPSPKASTFPLKVTAAKAPMCLILDHVSRNTSASITLKRAIHNML
nr:hypothetical protein [Tanacetum cinerariifolium]